MGLLETALRKCGTAELIEIQTKNKIREIVRAYRHSWDIYSELIQNSVDAINRKFKILNDPTYYLYEEYHERFSELESSPSFVGRIKIEVDVRNKIIKILDNGIGIPLEKIEEFLLPEGTDKRIGNEYGFKGYGLTFAAFISRDFYIASRPFASETVHEFGLTGLFDWLTDDNNTISFPSDPIPNAQRLVGTLEEGYNTIVRVELEAGYNERFPAISSADFALNLIDDGQKLRGFEYILRSRTAIGNTKALFNMSPIVPIEISLNVIFPDGTSTEKVIPYRYDHPKDHDEVSINSYDFRNYVEQLPRTTFSRSFRGLYHAVQNIQVGERRPVVCNYALSCISTTRLSNVEADFGLNKFEIGDVGISSGVYLSIDGMPTGLRIDDWYNRGHFLKRYFIIVDAQLDISNQLDPGRKGISQYYGNLISEKAIGLLNESTIGDSDSFAQYAARHLDHGRGREEGGLPSQDFQIKINQVRERASQQEDEYVEKLLKKLRRNSSLFYLPSDEQEVIALFYELLSRNIIKGYRTIYLGGSSAVYDAALNYEIECRPENIVPTDPIGIGRVLVRDLQSRGIANYIHRDHYAGSTRQPELCIDFKQSIGGFLDEVIRRPGRTSKDPAAIDLLIAWDADIPSAIPSAAYTLDPIPDDQRIFHSTTSRLGLIREYSTEIKCIILKEIISKLAVSI